MVDGLRDLLPDVEGVGDAVGAGLLGDVLRPVGEVAGDGEVRREVREIPGTGQDLVGGQDIVASGEAVVVLRRHHLHLGAEAVGDQVQGDHPVPHAAVDPVAGVVPGVREAPGGLGGGVDLRHVVHGVPRLALQVLDELNVVGEHLVQGVVQADVDGHGGGDRHQHHGGEDTDAGQAHGILLHPVQKAGDGGEVPGLVVKFRVGPEALQDGDGPGGEETIGADDDQDHRDEEPEHGLDGILRGNRQEVPAPQGQHAQKDQQPFRPGLPLPGGGAVEQVHRLGPADAP